MGINSTETLRFAVRSAASVFYDRPDFPGIRRRSLLLSLLGPPDGDASLNTSESISQAFHNTIRERGITQVESHPYWLGKDTPYNSLEVFGTCIQFVDHHSGPLPRTTLPPRQDIERYIDAILAKEGKVTMGDQFTLLLDITNNNLVGAANLGMMADRIMARFSDSRAYPELTIQEQKYNADTPEDAIATLMRTWNAKMAKFHTPGSQEGNDGVGDQYYFWTHFFAALAFDPSTPTGKIYQGLFANGNNLLHVAKRVFARKGDLISSHGVASRIGRELALEIRKELRTSSAPAQNTATESSQAQAH